MLQQLIDWGYAHERQIMSLVSGLIIAWGVTQRLKFFIPACWSYHAREVATQAVAFIVGGLSTYVIWGPSTDAAVAGVLVGLASPAIWNIGTFLVGVKWPWMKDLLSQDVRKGVRLSGDKHD